MEELWPDASLVMRKRRQLGLTQQKLAALSDVPQSVISKIEKGKIAEPSYTTMSKLFRALERFEKGSGSGDSQLTASDLMNPQVITVTPSVRAKDAWNRMKKDGFSQLPVVDGSGRIVGGVVETDLMLEDGERLVNDVMGDHFPVVTKNTKLSSIAGILRTEKAVLVVDRGKLVGIITAYDLIENAYRRNPGSLR